MEDASAPRGPTREKNLRFTSKHNVQSRGFYSMAIKIGDMSVIVYGGKLDF